MKLDKIDKDLFSIQTIDEISTHIKLTESQVDAIKQRELRKTGNPAYLLKLKIGAQIVLTANVNTESS